jgi:serine/threonine protein kinase
VTPCPDENQIIQYLQGLTPAAPVPLGDHLDRCDACHELVARLAACTVTPEPAEEPPLPTGTQLGRYVVLDLIGRGGMGMVYCAYDPELDRKVALKLIRPDVLSTEALDAVDRLQGEAQAMARLSHPNVVMVFDVGTYGGQIFFTMELLRGGSLREVVSAAPKAWRRTLSLYRAAAEGLAAAHAAGIVHRDFKPENVLVGDDGRVRVTDFGLAANHRAATEVGETAGTPGYMAPEQWLGQVGGPETDQYSFCVALHEALYGHSPQPGRALEASTPVPPEVYRVLQRGMSPDRGARWKSMDELVHQLGRASRFWSPRWLLACSAVLMAVLLAWGHDVFARVRQHREEQELRQAASRLPKVLAAQMDAMELRLSGGLRSEPVLQSLEEASDLDAALGLAPRGRGEAELDDAHEILRSADLPELKAEHLLLLVNSRGHVVFDLANEDRRGEVAPRLPPLIQALSGLPTKALWSARSLREAGLGALPPEQRQEVMLLFALPVIRGQTLVGAALIGHWMSPSMFRELERAVGARVGLRSLDEGGSPNEWMGARQLVTLSVPLTDSGGGPWGLAWVARDGDPASKLDQLVGLLRWPSLALALAVGTWAAIRGRRFA